MQKIVLGLLSSMAVSAFAQVGDSGKISLVYFTNSSGEDVRLVAENPANNSGYRKFNCLYSIPKKYQQLPSPAFRTMMEPGSKQQGSLQYAIVPAGSTLAYAFNSSCDNADNIETAERFSLRSAQDYAKLYVSIGDMHQDVNNGVLDYTKYVSVHAIWGDVVAPAGGIAPFQVTVLPITQ